MPALQVRDFPAELYSCLRDCAKREHRSISQQTIIAVREHLDNKRARGSSEYANTELTENMTAITNTVLSQLSGGALERHVPVAESYVEKRRRLFAEIDALPEISIPDDFPSPTQIVRELRDER